jgi:hypothetical protein
MKITSAYFHELGLQSDREPRHKKVGNSVAIVELMDMDRHMDLGWYLDHFNDSLKVLAGEPSTLSRS